MKLSPFSRSVESSGSRCKSERLVMDVWNGIVGVVSFLSFLLSLLVC